MTLSNIVFSAESFANNSTMTLLKRLEDSVGAGRNGYLLSIVQLAQAAQATAIVDQALTVANRLPIPLYLRRVVVVTPVLLAILAAKGRDALTALADHTTNQNVRSTLLAIRDNKTLHATLIFVQDHYGTMCHVAAVVSSFVLLYYGNLFFAIPALIVLGVGLFSMKTILLPMLYLAICCAMIGIYKLAFNK